MRDVVELGLRKSSPPAASGSPTPGARSAGAPAAGPAAGNATPLKGAAEAFLRVLSDFKPDADEKDMQQFVASIDDFRAQIAASGHEQEVRSLVASSVRVCEQFLKRSRHYYATREHELTEMIGILREVAQLIAGDSAEFNSQMRVTTERFKGIALLDDIRELKKNLTDEANALQKTIENKRKKDENALSALTQKVETLEAHLVEAEEQAAIDALTRIPNRGTFDRSLARMVKAARASKTPLSLAMVDIDDFKKINDVHGHPIGDRVLLCAAQWLTSAVRHTDVVARYGGEEFGIILSDADLAAGETRFRAVIAQIASRSFEYEVEGETRSVRFTMSCGMAQLAGSETDQDLVQRADQALYDAKKAGRNRVVAKKRSKLGALFG